MDELKQKRLEKKVQNLVEEFGHLKVNLPRDEDNFTSGNGEGCWAVPISVVSLENINHERGTARVLLCNDSAYWPKFTWGSEIVVDCSRNGRPVALMSQFLGQKCEAKEILEKVMNGPSSGTT